MRVQTLKTLMQGSYDLYGKVITSGRPNIKDFGPAPASSGAMVRDEKRKEQVDETKKRRKPAQDGDAPPPHANSGNKHQAILGKGTEYTKNGAEYIRKDSDRKNVYSNFSHLGPPNFQMLISQMASIAVSSNFTPSPSGQQSPYPWRGHHLIPGESFYTKDSNGKPVFDKDENFEILLQTPYDIDHGHNQIMLPSAGWAVPVHALMQHPNNHNEYSLDVITRLKQIDDEIDTLRGQNEPHENTVASVFDNLQKLEVELWNMLLKISRKAVRLAADGQRYDGPWCRWKTQSSKDYGWPALW